MLEMRNNQMQILLSGPEREYKPVIEFEGSAATHHGLRAAPERRLEINLAKILSFVRKYRGVGMEGSSDGHAPILLLAVQPGRFFGTRC
jgi:hypothetical protein